LGPDATDQELHRARIFGKRARYTAELAAGQSSVRTEKLGETAAEFDRVHSIQRAVEVGSVDAIISAAELRPRIIEAIEHGMKR
jgi:hypothetical protein